jgi:hypothetical protein
LPTELSRRSWPPRDRTAQYLRIRQAPSTSWVVASGCGRSRTGKAGAHPGSVTGSVAHPGAERARVELARPELSCFRGRSRRQSGCLSIAEDGVLETHPANWATRFPSGDRAPAASSSRAESGEFESHGVSRALVSSEARHPGRFTLHGVTPPPAHKSDRPDSNRRCNPGQVTC